MNARELILVALAAIAAGCGGGSKISITDRDATDAECPGGGHVLVSGDQVIPICNGQDGKDGSDGAPGAPGATGATGARGPQGLAGTVGEDPTTSTNCTGSYISGSTTVYVTLDYITFADGSRYGTCALNRRLDRIVDVSTMTETLCFMNDWSTLNPSGGTDGNGQPLTMNVVVDTTAGNITAGIGGAVLSPLDCTDFDPITGDYK